MAHSVQPPSWNQGHDYSYLEEFILSVSLGRPDSDPALSRCSKELGTIHHAFNISFLLSANYLSKSVKHLQKDSISNSTYSPEICKLDIVNTLHFLKSKPQSFPIGWDKDDRDLLLDKLMDSLHSGFFLFQCNNNINNIQIATQPMININAEPTLSDLANMYLEHLEELLHNLHDREVIAFTLHVEDHVENSGPTIITRHNVLCEFEKDNYRGGYNFSIYNTGYGASPISPISVGQNKIEKIFSKFFPSLSKTGGKMTYYGIPAETMLDSNANSPSALRKLIYLFNEAKSPGLTHISVFYTTINDIFKENSYSISEIWGQQYNNCAVSPLLEWVACRLPKLCPDRGAQLFYRIYGIWLDIYSTKLQNISSYDLSELRGLIGNQTKGVDFSSLIQDLTWDARRTLLLLHLLEKEVSSTEKEPSWDSLETQLSDKNDTIESNIVSIRKHI